MPSRVVGVNKLRRTLRRIDPDLTKQLREVMASGARAIERDARAMAPVDQGDLRDSIQVLISRDGLTAIIGPAARAAEIVRRRTGSEFGRIVSKGRGRGKQIRLSIRNKRLLMNFYKGYWYEFGTKGDPRKGVHPQPARPFMRPAYDRNAGRITAAARAQISSVLERAARG